MKKNFFSNSLNVLPISGKDSVALYLYLNELGIRIDKVYNINHGFDHPDNIKFLYDSIKKLNLNVEFLYKKDAIIKFSDLCLKYGSVPNKKFRWCTYELKLKKLNEYLKNLKVSTNKVIVNFVGLRYDELKRCSTAKVVISNVFQIYPFVFAGYTIDDILYILKKYNVYPFYYPKFSSLGCFFCPFQSIDNWYSLYLNHRDLFNFCVHLEKITNTNFNLRFPLQELIKRYEQKNNK